MENLNKQIDKLNCILHGNGSTYSVYPYDKYSIQEVICEVVTKINEVIDVVEEYTAMVKSLLEWIQDEGITTEVKSYLDEMLLDGRLADIINVELFDELNCKINDLYDNKLYISVKEYGAKGDGVNDDTNSIKECLYYCMRENKTMYLPGGIYLINDTILPVLNDNDNNKNVPISIKGESYLTTFIEKTGSKDFDFAFDFAYCNKVNCSELNSKTLTFNTLDNSKYWEGEESWVKSLRNKDFFLQNLIYSGNGGYTSYYNYINSPCPPSYERYSNGNYQKYPLEITNGSGYNAININNFSTNQDGTIGEPKDNSAIGIVDRTNNSTGVIFIDMMGERSFERYVSRTAPIKSEVTKKDTVWEIHRNGHIAIGCSVDENDTVAPGWGAIKVRDISPCVELFDYNNSNMKSKIGMENQVWGEELFIKFAEGGGLTLIKDPDTGLIFVSGLNSGGVSGGVKINHKGDLASSGLIFDNNNSNKQTSIFIDDKGLLRVRVGEIIGSDGYIIGFNNNGSDRPILRNTGFDIGFCHFDTILETPIWWTGTKWVNAIGTTV